MFVPIVVYIQRMSFVFKLPVIVLVVLLAAVWIAAGMFLWSHTFDYRWAWMCGYGAVTVWLVGWAGEVVFS